MGVVGESGEAAAKPPAVRKFRIFIAHIMVQIKQLRKL